MYTLLCQPRIQNTRKHRLSFDNAELRISPSNPFPLAAQLLFVLIKYPIYEKLLVLTKYTKYHLIKNIFINKRKYTYLT